jgi:general L-amino acid transport system permease protein
MSWVRENLFSSWGNTLTSCFIGFVLAWALVPFVDWAVISADWGGSKRTDCNSGGACWVYVIQRFDQFMYGFYPVTERWRIDVVGILLVVALTLFFWPRVSARLALLCWALALFFCWFLLTGGVLALPYVETRLWGGMMLTVVLTVGGLVLAFPVAILLALGRRSSLPLVRISCTAFIELWRGVPLITVLFMASVMLPLFLPDGAGVDKLLRALIGVSLFAGAYLAEVIRGGLQAIPRGQYEAAAALGLGYWKTMTYVIMPQALRHVIPGLLNTIIALFKDTTLVLIIGMFDFLGIIQASLNDQEWLGLAAEGYVFAALIYWSICYSLSRLSIKVEQHSGVHRV